MYNLGVYLAIVGITWSLIQIFYVLVFLLDRSRRWHR